jgi:hypothetical protein
MNILNNGMTRFFDLLLAPLAPWPALAMVVVSALTAVWALLLFKAVTPQDRLTRVRDRLFGHIYEMGLYQDHLRVVGRIQWNLARANLRYLSLTLPALVVLTVPMVLTLAQLDSRFSHRPLHAGEETVFAVTLSDGAAAELKNVRLEVPAGLTVRAGPVRDRATGSVAWRLTQDAPGDHELVVWRGDQEVVRRVVPGGEGFVAVGETSRDSWLHQLLYPGAPTLPADGTLSRMSLSLPDRTTAYLGLRLDWLVAFMIFSLLVGLAIKDVLRVSI